MEASHWRCKFFGHRAETAPWSVSATVVGFVGYCRRCGDVLAAHPTRDFLVAEKEMQKQAVNPSGPRTVEDSPLG